MNESNAATSYFSDTPGYANSANSTTLSIHGRICVEQLQPSLACLANAHSVHFRLSVRFRAQLPHFILSLLQLRLLLSLRDLSFLKLFAQYFVDFFSSLIRIPHFKMEYENEQRGYDGEFLVARLDLYNED